MFGEPKQQFRNDYTRIRNTEMPVQLTTLPGGSRTLSGNAGTGVVSTPKDNAAELDNDPLAFNKWSYFPNTFQLRDQYTASNDALGYPVCLSACPLAE